jgi:hypothetical protein
MMNQRGQRKLSKNQQYMSNQVADVHQEVKTANGLTIGALADIAQGKDIERNVAAEDRTLSEQHYVDKLDVTKAEEKLATAVATEKQSAGTEKSGQPTSN